MKPYAYFWNHQGIQPGNTDRLSQLSEAQPLGKTPSPTPHRHPDQHPHLHPHPNPNPNTHTHHWSVADKQIDASTNKY